MIVVMKLSATGSEIERVEQRLEEMGFKSHLIHGVDRIVIGAVGEKKIAFPTGLELLPGVEKVVPVMAPYKLVSREVREETSRVTVGDLVFGGESLVVCAGPCAVENEEQLVIARRVKAAGCFTGWSL